MYNRTTAGLLMLCFAALAMNCGNGETDDGSGSYTSYGGSPGNSGTGGSGGPITGPTTSVSGASSYAPDTVLTRTLVIGDHGPYTMEFTGPTSCVLPNYTMTSGYAWNEHPSYTYRVTSASTATVTMQFTIIATGLSSSTLKVHYAYVFHLTFTGSGGGSYRADETRTSSYRVGSSSPTDSTSEDTFRGSFSLE